jgi:WD40 repeat protein
MNDLSFNLAGDKLASCDSDGIVKVWDVRMVKEKNHYDSGDFSVNSVDFDRSGTILETANTEIKIYNEALDRLETTFADIKRQCWMLCLTQSKRSYVLLELIARSGFGSDLYAGAVPFISINIYLMKSLFFNL